MLAQMFNAFLKDERASTAIEYSLLLGLLALAIISALTTLGAATSGSFQEAADSYP